jgi:hypothetical protein
MVARLDARTDSIIVASAGGLETNVTYTVPLGVCVSIIHAYAYHDDLVARNCWWEKDTGLGFGITGSDLTQIEFGVAAGTFRQLYDDSFPGQLFIKKESPLMLRAGQSIRWSVDPLKTPGAILTMKMIVDKYLGDTAYGS